ncbi:MAG: hemerythrin family protein [Treponema sp.]|nr:hemerythrin family protein [Treponema sp.]
MPDKITASEPWKSMINHNILIVWEPSYNLGIPIVDEQHRGIVSTINSLCYAIQYRHGNEMLRPVIGMVTEYTRIHFEIEEDFLKKCGYPNLEDHRKLHEELTNALSHTSHDSIWNKDPQEFLEFLKKWWINHICKEDRVFSHYLTKNKS